MKKRIHSRAELKLEINRLTEKQHLLEQQIKGSIHSISEKLKPINLIKSSFRSVMSDSELKNQFTSKGVEAILGFVISNLIFRKSNYVVRSIATLLGSTVAMNIFGDDSAKYIEKIKELYKKIKDSFGKNDQDDSIFDEEDIYRN